MINSKVYEIKHHNLDEKKILVKRSQMKCWQLMSNVSYFGKYKCRRWESHQIYYYCNIICNVTN